MPLLFQSCMLALHYIWPPPRAKWVCFSNILRRICAFIYMDPVSPRQPENCFSLGNVNPQKVWKLTYISRKNPAYMPSPGADFVGVPLLFWQRQGAWLCVSAQPPQLSFLKSICAPPFLSKIPGSAPDRGLVCTLLCTKASLTQQHGRYMCQNNKIFFLHKFYIFYFCLFFNHYLYYFLINTHFQIEHFQ